MSSCLHREDVVPEEEEIILRLPSVFFRPFLEETLSEKFLKLEVRLATYLSSLDYTQTTVTHISNPLDHAELPHRIFLCKYLDGEKRVLFLGMNPGPWGMCQTGIPFGEVSSCVNFLGICAPVNTKAQTHPKRPIQGFDCQRREVSGERFWSLFTDVSLSPKTFFKNAFVYNYCPLAFMKVSGKNVTPPEIPPLLRNKILRACDAVLLQILGLLRTQIVIGVGKFSEQRASKLVSQNGLNIRVGFLMHPSPINPLANKGWKDIALKSLTELNVLKYLQPDNT